MIELPPPYETQISLTSVVIEALLSLIPIKNIISKHYRGKSKTLTKFLEIVKYVNYNDLRRTSEKELTLLLKALIGKKLRLIYPFKCHTVNREQIKIYFGQVPSTELKI